MSRANHIISLIVESAIQPENLTRFYAKLEVFLRTFLQHYVERYGESELNTKVMVQMLNERVGKYYRIRFIQRDDDISSPELFVGGAVYSIQESAVKVRVNKTVNAALVLKKFDYTMNRLKSIINHELVHKKQFMSNPYRDRYHQDLDISFHNYQNKDGTLTRKTQIDGVPIKYPKTAIRVGPIKSYTDLYLAQPEEIMAHARTVYELLRNRDNWREAAYYLSLYLKLGKDHPAYKRFMKYLIEYMTRSGMDVSILNKIVRHVQFKNNIPPGSLSNLYRERNISK